MNLECLNEKNALMNASQAWNNDRLADPCWVKVIPHIWVCAPIFIGQLYILCLVLLELFWYFHASLIYFCYFIYICWVVLNLLDIYIIIGISHERRRDENKDHNRGRLWEWQD
jgi:hypothetical protein